MAHCTLEEAKELHETIRKAVMNYSMKLGRVFSLGIGIDIKGPEVRVGKINTVENVRIRIIQISAVVDFRFHFTGRFKRIRIS